MKGENLGKTIVSPLDLSNPEITKLTPIQYRIVEEIIEAIDILGGKNDLTTPLCSWGDTQTEGQVLEMLIQWNSANKQLQRQ